MNNFPERICAECGLKFRKYRPKKRKSKLYFCDKKCQGKYFSKHVKPKKGKFYKCGWCKKDVFRTDCWIKCKKNKNVFCNQKCHYAWRKGKIVCPTQHLWKKGQRPWNKGLSMEVSAMLKMRAGLRRAWRDPKIREKFMKRDITNFRKASTESIRDLAKSGELSKRSKEIHKRKMMQKFAKLGVNLNGNKVD